jgi:NAD+ diphosphatase
MPRMACPDSACGFVLWDNPTPVVAAIVEHEGELILARNKAWAVPFFALITGFLERTDPSPTEAVIREVKEELGLDAQGAHFVGHYRFERQNQIILAYHVPATGQITLGDELADYRRIAPAKARYWPVATGLALRDWLISQGHQPQAFEVPETRPKP